MIGTPEPLRTADIVGVEHEYAVARHGGQVEFAPILNSWDIGRRGLDPADPYARPLPSGAVVTADGDEAEIALQPIRVQPWFSTYAVRTASREQRNLARLLGAQYELFGASTHLSIATLPRHGRAIAVDFVNRFASDLMLLLDLPSSPGLLVRPRPGRTELGGEFCIGDALSVALVVATAAVRSYARRRRTRAHTANLPPQLAGRVVPAVARFGWYIDRRAYGSDLYREGRRALLRTERGATMTAQEHLELAWASTRDDIADVADPREVAAVDDVIAGRRPLRLEDQAAADTNSVDGSPEAHDIAQVCGAVPLMTTSCDGLEIGPVMVTWDTTIMLALDSESDRRAFVALPRRAVARFHHELADGLCAQLIGKFLRRPIRHRRLLLDRNHAARPSLWDEVSCRGDLIAAERPISESHALGSGWGWRLARR